MCQSGYREVEHTADWELEVWAPDLAGLLIESARGMYAMMGTRIAARPRCERILMLETSDQESLLVSFLSELLYCIETESLAFDECRVLGRGDSLIAELRGAPIISIDKEIKAVTYHNLCIQHTSNELRVRIVFDV